MGVLGAYWYMYSWSTMCILYWIGLLWKGTFELAAVRVIGAYLVLDLANGFIGRSAGAMGGVANFAHVGGAFVGAVLVWALGYKRARSIDAALARLTALLEKFPTGRLMLEAKIRGTRLSARPGTTSPSRPIVEGFPNIGNRYTSAWRRTIQLSHHLLGGQAYRCRLQCAPSRRRRLPTCPAREDQISRFARC